jgi:hypothetical protein
LLCAQGKVTREDFNVPSEKKSEMKNYHPWLLLTLGENHYVTVATAADASEKFSLRSYVHDHLTILNDVEFREAADTLAIAYWEGYARHKKGVEAIHAKLAEGIADKQ